MADEIIKLRGVKKVFQTDEVETHALVDIHMEIRRGEYVSISGPSGCGKSTLLAILGLLDSPNLEQLQWFSHWRQMRTSKHFASRLYSLRLASA